MSLLDHYNKELITQLNSNYTDTSTAYVAVSAGVDSMCLLHLLCLGKSKLNYSINVIHVLHGIRPDNESKRDLAIVQSICRKLNIPVIICFISQGSLAQWQKLLGGLESAARQYRYWAMLKYLSKNDLLLTAHHADDLVETMLLSIFNSQISSPLQISDDRVVRPYLILDPPMDRFKILQIATEFQIPYNIDSTNANFSYNRNYIRHRVIPLLESQFSGFKKRIMGFYEQWSIIHEALKRQKPVSPWKSVKPLNSLLYYAYSHEIFSMPVYYTINSIQQVILEMLSYYSNRKSFIRISSQLILNIVDQLKSKYNEHVEAYGIIFTRVNNIIYLNSALAFYLKKGYFKTIRSGKNYFLQPMPATGIKVMVEHNSNHKNVVIRSLRNIDCKHASLKMLLKKIIVIPCLSSFVMVLLNGSDYCALIYPDIQLGSWNILDLDTRLTKKIILEEIDERE